MSKRVLFVDDEDWSVSPYFEILKDNHIEVELAENGASALAALRKQAFDLIVLDVMFAPGDEVGNQVEPRKAGAKLLRALRENAISDLKVKPDVPVLVLTAVTDQHLLDEIEHLGVSDILRKPVSFERVVSKILDTLEIKR